MIWLLNVLAYCSRSSCADEFVVLTGWIKVDDQKKAYNNDWSRKFTTKCSSERALTIVNPDNNVLSAKQVKLLYWYHIIIIIKVVFRVAAAKNRAMYTIVQ